MKINILSTYEAMCEQITQEITSLVQKKNKALICLAGGETPKGVFKKMIEAEKNKKVDFSSCYFVSLDEWVGLGIETRGSCIETLYSDLFNHISVAKDHIMFFDGKTNDLPQECQRIDEFIFQHGGIDLIVLGVGMNGHIGFNEPGVDPNQYSIVIPLDPVTKEVSVKYFDTPMPVEYGISLGMKHILEAKNIILMANGERKKSIVSSTIHDDISNKNPATLLKRSPSFTFYVDESAYSE